MPADPTNADPLISRKNAVRFIVAVGLVSLFADVTYEGARSITGPFLATLGASGAAVGLVAGLGELAGYGLRLVAGVVADRTRRYWLLVGVGYTVNLLAVPALALAGRWEVAAVLMIMERVGKAIRAPARDVLLSHATSATGHGWGFGLHEALDQIGAVAGPLVVAATLALSAESYRQGFAVLLVPALLALAVLALARRRYPDPSTLAVEPTTPVADGPLPRKLWLHLAAVALVAIGYADFPLVAYHFERTALAPATFIPLFYAGAMAADAFAALGFGRLFDRRGYGTLALAAGLGALAPPLLFLGGAGMAAAGVLLWGVGMGAQESVMRAAVAQMVPAARRGTAYGLLNGGYGLAWFAGSVALGALYDVSIPALVGVAVAAQLAAVPLFLLVRRAS